MYASYYMCRYNFRYATPGMVDEFGFSTTDIADIFGVWALAYGTGQLVNGLISDRIGGKRCMLIGAVATILINLTFGYSSLVSNFATFALLALLNGYFQAFGAPGMVKINAAWFHRTERGTFAGIGAGSSAFRPCSRWAPQSSPRWWQSSRRTMPVFRARSRTRSTTPRG
jgi:sugar phosphate permease